MNRAAQLAIELTEQGGDTAAAGIDKVTASARAMGDTVDQASRQADEGAGRLDRAAESSDNLASKSSQATGGLGALAAGFELVGLGPYAAGLESAAMATDFFSGVGDIANLVLESQAVLNAKAKVQAIASTVATKAQTVATKASTVAQKAMNLAMRANPVGLIITGVLLLAGALILAYKKSDTFRAIVDKAFAVARVAVEKVIDAFQGIAPTVEAIADKVSGFVSGVVDKLENMRDKVVGTWDVIKDKGVAAFDALLAPVQAIIDLVQNLIDKIQDIHLPDLPDNPFNRGGFAVASTTTATTLAPVYITMTVNPAPGSTSTQAADQAQATMDAIDARLRSVGRKTVFRRT